MTHTATPTAAAPVVPAAPTASIATAPPPAPPADDTDDLVARMLDYLVKLKPDLAKQRKALADDMRKEFGGQRWYVASRQPTERQERIAAILATFNGRNASEVARTLKISRATVYRVLKQPGRFARAEGGKK